MFKNGAYTLLLTVGLLSPLAVPNADAFDRRDDVREARKDLRKETREAKKELREDLRRADDRDDVRKAYREYNEDIRDARREYRNDAGDYSRGRSVSVLPRGARIVNMRGERLYYANGLYYRPVGPSRFVVVNP